MPKIVRSPELIVSLAVASARGESMAEWSRKNGVSVRTSQLWRQSEEFKAARATVRGAMVDIALDRMAGALELAAATVRELAGPGAPPGIRLQAARAIVADYAVLSELGVMRSLLARLTAEEQRQKAARAAGYQQPRFYQPKRRKPDPADAG